ncbi:CRISPR system Cascade subunit CasB [Methylobacter tundripaludum]|uniref:CRISPR system Cascade subunit CasB n=1 Tax=Methylobacter tundripaludum TaxID=173365 RepID=A0A2S6HGH1_9GAMM|nr:type I-E CRISPR-associated protein Cse2/CasB [Methylobacter tundripaludum]PPK76584.1 CRISPR system Cascade subunit CasB [Methylobacter tundripaludum]
MSEDYFLNAAEKQAVHSWYVWLDDNRGDRARLRRAESPEDILLTDAFFHFLAKMPEQWQQSKPMLTSASIAGALSHVKTDKQTPSKLYNSKATDAPKKSASFAEQLASSSEGKSKAPMSELRFQQLQKSPTTDDFYRRIIRAIGLLGGNVNIISLANDIIHWHREFEYQVDHRQPANRLAVRWATDYFTALPKNSD